MNGRDFSYWLQGFFELRKGSIPLSEPQLTIIKNHLALVKNVEGELSGFPAWLESMFSIEKPLGTENMLFNKKTLTTLIQQKLADEFKHVIDPEHGDKLSERLDIHDGKTKPEESPRDDPPPSRSSSLSGGWSGGGSGTRYMC